MRGQGQEESTRVDILNFRINSVLIQIQIRYSLYIVKVSKKVFEMFIKKMLQIGQIETSSKL